MEQCEERGKEGGGGGQDMGQDHESQKKILHFTLHVYAVHSILTFHKSECWLFTLGK